MPEIRNLDFNIADAIRVEQIALSLVPESMRKLLTDTNEDGSTDEVATIIIESSMLTPARIGGQVIGHVAVKAHSAMLLRPRELAQLVVSINRLTELSPTFAAQMEHWSQHAREQLLDETLWSSDISAEVEKVEEAVREGGPAQP